MPGGACTVGLNQISVARNPNEPTQNKLKKQKNRKHCVTHSNMYLTPSIKKFDNKKAGIMAPS